MIQDAFIRSEAVYGKDNMQKIYAAHVAVFGLGGVGGAVAESLARLGVGRLTLIDGDVVAPSNLNRQTVATASTLGRPKAEAMREHLLSIQPSLIVTAHQMFYLPDTADAIDLTRFDYVADAVDTVAAKIELAVRCTALGVPIISCMGAGNKLTTAFRVADLYETTVCPLARVMRRELKKRGVPRLRTVYSTEPPVHVGLGAAGCHTPGSTPFAPAAAGLTMAAAIALDLMGIDANR